MNHLSGKKNQQFHSTPLRVAVRLPSVGGTLRISKSVSVLSGIQRFKSQGILDFVKDEQDT